MQIKAGFKKEWLQFTRTFRLGGIILAIASFALADPLMYWAMNLLLEGISTTQAAVADTGALDIGDVASVFNNAGVVFSMTMSEFCSTSTLIIMLILMSPCGGEQKKRATIIPSCTGLGTFEYLIPKYILYPVTVFAVTFVSCLLAGGICNLVFTDGTVGAGMMFLAALLCAVYLAFIIVVYMSIGLCTSRPGVVTIFMYIGVSIVQIFLNQLGLTKFHPLTLRALVTGEMFTESFALSDEIGSIAVGTVLSVVIGVMMFVLTLAVQKGTRINNQEDKPEF